MIVVTVVTVVSVVTVVLVVTVVTVATTFFNQKTLKKKSNCNETPNVTKLKKSNFDKTQKLKL